MKFDIKKLSPPRTDESKNKSFQLKIALVEDTEQLMDTFFAPRMTCTWILNDERMDAAIVADNIQPSIPNTMSTY
jgi:hypothetical protein